MRRILAAVLLGAGCCTAIAQVKPTEVSAGSEGKFYYGFDLTNQAPDPWNGKNDPEAVKSARAVLASLPGSFVDQSIMGFGIVHNPEPEPGKYDFRSLADRLKMIKEAGDIPIITLVSAPDWMKDAPNGKASLFDSPPTPNHFGDFADLAAHVAQVNPDVRYFVVWSEIRGFWDVGAKGWDAKRYTDMYNAVYTAIKKVRPDAMVGGPYVVMTARSAPVRGKVSELRGDWGYLDQGMLDVLTYWLEHKVGADFVAMDGATSLAKEDRADVMDAVTGSQVYAKVNEWVRVRTKLPIFWMESQIQPHQGWTIDQSVAARVATLLLMSTSGASVGMQWQPQAQAGWADQGLWTSTLQSGGGQPTAMLKTLREVMPTIAARPKLEAGQPKGTLVAVGTNGVVALNTTAAPVVVKIGGRPVQLAAGQVMQCVTVRTCEAPAALNTSK